MVQDIDDEMESNAQKRENQTKKETMTELEKGMTIRENDRLGFREQKQL